MLGTQSLCTQKPLAFQGAGTPPGALLSALELPHLQPHPLSTLSTHKWPIHLTTQMTHDLRSHRQQFLKQLPLLLIQERSTQGTSLTGCLF